MALHTIKAQLHDNPLTENPSDLIARVASERTLTVRDICLSAVTRGGADITAAAMEHAAGLFLKEMNYCLCDGFAVNADGYFSASAHIKGAFGSSVEKFDPAKQRLVFEFHQGAVLRREAEAVEVKILGMADAALYIAQVTDMRTGSINDLLTPGRNLRIAGTKIKIAGSSSDCGVFFVHCETNEGTRVDTPDVIVNNPSELIVVIPPLAAGEYRVAIRTQFTGSGATLLKQPRETIFDRTLTVQ